MLKPNYLFSADCTPANEDYGVATLAYFSGDALQTNKPCARYQCKDCF
jgi:hypothetical protein